MHCRICDSMIENVKFDARYFNEKGGPIDPCPFCMEKIFEVFGDYPDDAIGEYEYFEDVEELTKDIPDERDVCDSVV